MAVRLDLVPAQAPWPVRPRIRLWLGLLLSFLLLGLGATMLWGTEPLQAQRVDAWGLALGVPLLVWSLLILGRAVSYIGQQSVAEGWNAAREEDLARRIRRGRRSQQVLSVSLHTALRGPGDPTTQLEALLDRRKPLKLQPSRLNPAVLCRSRLPGDGREKPAPAMLRVMRQVLEDVSPTLAQLPDSAPLALLLEIDSRLPADQSRQLWQQAWLESGIRQSTVPVEQSGLAAVDHWLDQRIHDPALLLVVALQFAPEQPEASSEVAVGLLLGNRLTQRSLAPVAYLHRPEQARETTTEALLHAARQALDWVPLEAQAIDRGWRAGVSAQRDAALGTVLAQMPLPQRERGLHDLDRLLGHSGKAAPWLAIAAATHALQRGAGPQLIFSGDSRAEAGLWSTVLMPVAGASLNDWERHPNTAARRLSGEVSA